MSKIRFFLQTKTAMKVNTQCSIEYCSVSTGIVPILRFLYMLSHRESKSTTSYVLLSMSTMSTSNFEYEWYEHNIKIRMNVYKYQKL